MKILLNLYKNGKLYLENGEPLVLRQKALIEQDSLSLDHLTYRVIDVPSFITVSKIKKDEDELSDGLILKAEDFLLDLLENECVEIEKVDLENNLLILKVDITYYEIL